MDVCFGLVTIFLILDVTSARSTGNRPLRKKRYSGGVQLSSGKMNSRVVFPDELEDMTFLHNRNKSVLNSTGINSVDTVGIEPSSSQRPMTQGHIALLPFDTSTLTPNIPVLSTQAHDNTISRTPAPPKKTHSAGSHLSLADLISIKNMTAVKSTSELKCDEYAREVAREVPRTGTISQRLRRNVNNTCETLNHLTIEGFQARIGESPHMVGLLGRFSISDELQLMCGGTLISHTWILTAAHCTYGTNGGPTLARIGTARLSSQEGITVGLKNTIRHPDFRPPVVYADIALIKLVKAVTFSATIQPACLYQQYDAVPRKAWISGWGTIELAGEYMDWLEMTELDIVNNLYCSEQFNRSREIPYGITTSQICAGDPRGNWLKDACQGDSGGPLQIRHENECLFRLIGIISYGMGCGLPGIPSVYTRISYYLPWIEDNVWPQGQ